MFLADALPYLSAGEGVRKGLVSGSGSVGIFAVLGRSVEHAADRHGKPFTIIELAQEIHPRVVPTVVNNGILGATLPAVRR
jgi:hypothetical protein